MRHRMRPPSGKLSQQIRAANAEVQGRLDALLEADRFGPTPSHKGGLLPPLQEAKRDLGKVRVVEQFANHVQPHFAIPRA